MKTTESWIQQVTRSLERRTTSPRRPRASSAELLSIRLGAEGVLARKAPVAANNLNSILRSVSNDKLSPALKLRLAALTREHQETASALIRSHAHKASKELVVALEDSSSDRASTVSSVLSAAKTRVARVSDDQAIKLKAGLAREVALHKGALGFVWVHHNSSYPRPAHVSLHNKVFVYRNSPVLDLLRPSAVPLVEDLPELPGTAILCRCTASYFYSAKSLYRKAPNLFTRAAARVLEI